MNDGLQVAIAVALIFSVGFYCGRTFERIQQWAKRNPTPKEG